MTLSMTSLVPPSMELALVRSQLRAAQREARAVAHLGARAHEDGLRGRVVREVEPREEVVDGVVVEPEVDPRALEGQRHAPVGR